MAKQQINTQQLKNNQQWIPLSLQNSWVPYDAGSYPIPAVCKDSSGVVRLRGLIKSGTTTAGTVMVSGIPSGMRLSLPQHFILPANNAAAIVIVNNSGSVIILSGSNAWFDLAGISYVPDV